MLDLRCYVVTGAGDFEEIVAMAAQAARGGAGVIQVRSKPITARDLYQLSAAVAHAVAQTESDAKVLIDDRLDVALALKNNDVPIHGVHLGQDDLPVRDARALLGPDAIIGLTTGTPDLVRQASQDADVLDYIGAGPFRPTPTKDSGREPIGLAGYPELVRLSKLPIVAIGDVQPDDVPALAKTGVAGVAMVRAFMTTPDPAQLASQIVKDFDASHAE